MKESNLSPTASQFEGNGFTDRREEHHPENHSLARVGVEPTDQQVLSLLALPVCVPCRHSSAPMGFEPATSRWDLNPLISTLTSRWRALRAPAPQVALPVAYRAWLEGGIRTLSISVVLSESGLPVAYRAKPVPGAGIEPAASTFRAWRHYQQQLPRSRLIREGGIRTSTA